MKVIGLETGRTYVEGESKAECLRKLIEMYPSTQKHHIFKKGVGVEAIYPEPLKIERG